MCSLAPHICLYSLRRRGWALSVIFFIRCGQMLSGLVTSKQRVDSWGEKTLLSGRAGTMHAHNAIASLVEAKQAKQKQANKQKTSGSASPRHTCAFLFCLLWAWSGWPDACDIMRARCAKGIQEATEGPRWYISTTFYSTLFV